MKAPSISLPTLCISALFLLSPLLPARAQFSFKTEYFGKSAYRDQNNQKVAGSQGAALVYQGSLNVPLVRKMNEQRQPLLWGAALSATYVAFDNDHLAEDVVLSKLTNFQLALFHVRPLNEKWRIMAVAGAGLCMPGTRFSQIRMRHLIGNLGLLFIRRLSSGLELGGGAAFNNTFGFPMIFPALYFNWEYNRQWICKLSALEGFNLGIGYKLNSFVSLHFITEMNGQMALTKREGKESLFTHFYIVTGFRPQLTITDKITLPFTFGMNVMRAAYYDHRSLKSIFQSDRAYDPYFQLSPYVAASIEISF